MSSDRGAGVLPATQRFMTAAEYYQMPVGPPYAQLVEGELLMSPSPNFFHQEIIGNLHASLREYLKGHRRGKIVLSPSDVELDEGNVYQPDLYYVRKERLSLIDQQGMKGAPDFVVEVISSSTAQVDRGPKKAKFALHGVTEFWEIVPKTKMVMVWKLAESTIVPAARLALGDTLTTAILPGWGIPVSGIFEQ